MELSLDVGALAVALLALGPPVVRQFVFWFRPTTLTVENGAAHPAHEDRSEFRNRTLFIARLSNKTDFAQRIRAITIVAPGVVHETTAPWLGEDRERWVIEPHDTRTFSFSVDATQTPVSSLTVVMDSPKSRLLTAHVTGLAVPRS